MLIHRYPKTVFTAVLLLSQSVLPFSTLTANAQPAGPATSASANHGLIFGAPRVKGKDTNNLAAFGDACGKYLAITVAGRPEFGRTHLLQTVRRIAEEYGLPISTRFTVAEAVQVAKRIGATLPAVGEISEAMGKVTLSYQFYTLESKPVKTRLQISGTRDEILKRLPGFSNQLAAQLQVKYPSAPPVKATSQEMVELGKLIPKNMYSDDEEYMLYTLQDKIPLAAYIYIGSYHARVTPSHITQGAKATLAAFPDNAMVFGQIGGQGGGEPLFPLKAPLTRLAAKYPRNYALASCMVWLCRKTEEYDLEMKMARRVVSIAPRIPEAYMTLGATIGDTGYRIRNGKTIGQMTEAELEAVRKIYPEWLKTLIRAVELDPRFARGWLRVSTAAAFYGDTELAVKAWERSRELGEDPGGLYAWGLELFHPKWGGSPEKLETVVRQAIEADYSPVQAADMSDRLKKLGFQNEADRLMRRYSKN